MKKFLSLIIAILTVFTLVACAEPKDEYVYIYETDPQTKSVSETQQSKSKKKENNFEYVSYEHKFTNNKIIVKITALEDIKDLSFKVWFLTGETNTLHTVKEKFDLKKGENLQIVFSQDQIKSELNGQKPLEVKLKDVQGNVSSSKLIDTVIIILFIAVISGIVVFEIKKNKKDKQKEAEKENQQEERKEQNEAEQKRKFEEAKYKEAIKNKAGDFTDNYMERYKKTFHCKDDDYVRSKAEREIDNFFFDNEIIHIYEIKYVHPITKEMARPDFFLPKYNLYIEYFGRKEKSYVENQKKKIKMFQSDKTINFEYITYKDDGELYGRLKEICQKYSIPLK